MYYPSIDLHIFIYRHNMYLLCQFLLFRRQSYPIPWTTLYIKYVKYRLDRYNFNSNSNNNNDNNNNK